MTNAVSTQKVHAVMRQAGIRRSKWHASQRVKGWGTHTESYTLNREERSGDGATLVLGYSLGSDGYRPSEARMTRAMSKVLQAKAALDAAGITYQEEAGYNGLPRLWLTGRAA